MMQMRTQRFGVCGVEQTLNHIVEEFKVVCFVARGFGFWNTCVNSSAVLPKVIDPSAAGGAKGTGGPRMCLKQVEFQIISSQTITRYHLASVSGIQ